MTKLQKRAKPEALYLPLALQAGVPSATSPPLSSNVTFSPSGKPNSGAPLSPFQNTHRRAISTPRTPQTQWPLIASSSPPSVAYPTASHHDAATCGANCTRCGKRKLIQLNSPPSKNIPNSAAPLQPIPQAHMRAVSDGTVTSKTSPKRLSITTTPAIMVPGKPPCCQKCGRLRRPASLPVQPSSKQVQFQPSQTRQTSKNYELLRTNLSGTTSGTPYPNKVPSFSRSPSPPSRDHFHPYTSNGEHVISPLSPRRKVDFALPSKSTSGASSIPYSPLSQSESGNSTPEIGTGRLINLISNAIRETSPAVLADVSSSTEDLRTTHLSHSRSPIDAKLPFAPIELDSIPIGDTTADILSGYADSAVDSGSTPLTDGYRDPTATDGGYADYSYEYEWTDTIRIPVPVIRLPSVSVKEGVSRFKSLRGKSQWGTGGTARPGMRERFGSLRGVQQQQGWYGGSGSKYQMLESSVEVGVY